MKILIVDDDQDILSSLVEICEMNGHEVVSATTGGDALGHLLAGEGFDLVLLDMMLPKVDGWDFLRVKWKIPEISSVLVVIITASRRSKLSAEELQGAEMILTKPITISQVESVLRAAQK